MSFWNIFRSNTNEKEKENETIATKKSTAKHRLNNFAEELKSALLNSEKTSNGEMIGLNLGEKKEFQNQVNELINNIQTSYKGYSAELEKASKIKELNKSLTQNFKKNLQVMVDVTNLLNSYVQLFEVMKNELGKLNKVIGNDGEASLGDINHLESITQQQILSLQEEFNKQTKKLQDIYKQYDMQSEHDHITNARTQMTNIISNATDIWEKYPTESQQQGGSKRHGTRKQSISKKTRNKYIKTSTKSKTRS